MIATTSFDNPFSFVFVIILAVILIAAWVILAGSRFIQGGIVERPERVPQLYGYTVCLVALLWGVTTLISLVQNVQSLSAPELRHSSMGFDIEPSVTSFEAFRATYDRARRFASSEPNTKLDTVPETELRRRYEGLRADRIQRNTVEARQEIVRDVISLLIAAALFVFHWRWLRRRVAPFVVATPPSNVA